MIEVIVAIVVVVMFWLWGITIGWTLRERHAARVLENFIKEADTKVTEVDENQIHITIEKHNGVFYVYGRDNNQFMGQGNSVSELEENLMKRFPGKKFACPEKNMIEVGIIS
jgi:hypothetical protein